MGVTPEEVRRVAALARLRLEPAEAEAMTRQLNDILRHVDELQAVEISPDAGTATDRATAPDGAAAPLRADVPGPDPLAESPASFAPSWQDGFFTVPRLASHDEAEPADDGGAGGDGAGGGA